MIKLKFAILFFVFFSISAQSHKILESDDSHITIEFDFTNSYEITQSLINGKKLHKINSSEPILRMPGEPLIPFYSINVALPPNTKPNVSILKNQQKVQNNILLLPYINDAMIEQEEKEVYFAEEIYNRNKNFPAKIAELSDPISMRFINYSNLTISPFQYNPVSRKLVRTNKLILKIEFKADNSSQKIFRAKSDKMTEDFINSSIANSLVAKNWQGTYTDYSSSKPLDQYWYSVDKEYFKIYVDSLDLYKITYEDIAAIGLSTNNININSLELYCNGEIVPIEVFNQGDQNFGAGDYFKFVGDSVKPTPFAKKNIYNTENVYWLSFGGDSSFQYVDTDGFPDNNFDNTFRVTPYTFHYERDTLYERFGYATDLERDFWMWGVASGDQGVQRKAFSKPFTALKDFDDFASEFTVRINMHGMTTGEHRANIFITSQPVGTAIWDGQKEFTFEKTVSKDSIGLFPTNNFQVIVLGGYNQQVVSDEIRINWFEIEYPRVNRAFGNHWAFRSPPENSGRNRYNVSYWQGNDFKVYIPEKGNLIKNADVRTGENVFALFVDSIATRTLYFCASSDYSVPPKRIEKNINSDLRNTSNVADYIILTHPDFFVQANRLKEYRKNNLSGFENAQIKIVNIFDIYKEFSYGLVDPESIRDFIKYTFENWSGNPPSYLAILGDMSWDYRKLITDSRPNFVPSYPYHGTQFGMAVSDNMFGAVVGDDVVADLSIGRISCETPEEAEILINKILDYPGDNSKYWQQNILLIGAGESQNDEARFRFNDQSLLLDNNYISPQGFTAEKIFAFPDSTKPEHLPYLGNTPEIRAAFSRGTVMANFYGHGGGYQWDAVFLNDDIALINNEQRLPFISSITCYTAHFDNQEVFGEQFNSIPGRGSIGFWGHTGITFWAYGLDLNKRLYNEIFNEEKYVIGDAIRIAKSKVGNINSKLVKDHIALLTLLGDPAVELALPKSPDFYINPSDISISPAAPLNDDTVSVKIKVHNIGKVFTGDSVKIDVYDQIVDSTFLIESRYISSFGKDDSLIVKWLPRYAGIHNIKAELNSDGHINEDDISDNIANAQFTVFNLDNPNIVSPINGSKWKDRVDFVFVDVGEFISKDLEYFIEIDTTTQFQNPIIKTAALISNNFGEVEYQSDILQQGAYFWRSRIREGSQYSNWSEIRTFLINENEDQVSSSFSGSQLKLFNKSNLVYSNSNSSLVLNLEPLPPKPDNEHFIEKISVELPDELQGLSGIATDGTYIYVGHRAYYAIADTNYDVASKIFKYGTGKNGTQKGVLYGELSPVKLEIWKQYFYYDGGIYIPTGSAYNLVRMDTQTGDTATVEIPTGLMNENAAIQDGAFYLCSDGQYVYNLAYRDQQGEEKYTVRVLDPENNWSVVTPETVLSGSSYYGFSSFFVSNGYLYVFEKNEAGYMRNFPLDSYIFEDEWKSYIPFAGYFGWAYDYENDLVYASVFVPRNEEYLPAFSIYKGTYNQAFGTAVSPVVGPVNKWNNLEYEIDSQGSLGEYSVLLEGLNSQTSNWDSLNSDFPQNISLENIDASVYKNMRTSFYFQDTTVGGSQPLKLKNLSYDFESIPELVMSSNYFSFEDSLIQGFPVKANINLKNIGFSSIDSANINFYLNTDDAPIFTTSQNIEPDSTLTVEFDIVSDNLLFTNKIKSVVSLSKPDFYSFNNTIYDSFYVARDSVKPEFQITFDGLEIISGDIVSATPNIFISLKDNSPLPLDTSDFSIYFNNNPISFTEDSLNYTYIEYPNSESQINWKPSLIDGKHVLDVYAKDASDNYFDSTSYRISFVVDRENKVDDIYNYPNPFADDTYFTFSITGSKLPEEMKVKIFTVTGRLIKEIEIPVNQLGFGFNKFYWDGKDQDGNFIANGVYFCKFIILNNGEYFTEVKKIAKLK